MSDAPPGRAGPLVVREAADRLPSRGIGPRGRSHGFGRALAMLVVLAPLLVGCDSGGDEPPEFEPFERGPDVPVVIAPDAPIVLGVSVPVTGPDSVVGIADRDAVILAVERWREAHGARIQGHDIEVAVEDDGCTEADVAAVAARRLAERPGVVAVVGPNCSAGAVEAIPVYAEAGLTAVSGSTTQSDLTTNQPSGGFFFRTAYRNDLEGVLIGVHVISDLQATHGYLIDDGESYGQDLADSAQQLMEENGVDVGRVSVERGSVDFREPVQTIIAGNPQFVGFMGFNPEVALLYRQLRDAGYQGVFGAGDAAATPDFINAVGDAADGTLFAGCLLTLPEELAAGFSEVHGEPPGESAFTAQQIDATTLLLDAVAEVAQPQPDGSLVVEPQALRDAVAATEVRDGASGSFAFDASGDRVPPGGTPLADMVDAALEAQDVSAFVDLGLVPCQVQDGRFVNLIGPGAQPMR